MASAEPKLTEKGKGLRQNRSLRRKEIAPSNSPKGEGCHPDGKPMLKLTLIRDKDFKGGMKDDDAIKRKEIRYLIE